MSFIGSTNLQKNQLYVLIPKKEYQKVSMFQGKKIKVSIEDILNGNQTTIISQITTQGLNHFIPIYQKYAKDFEPFLKRDLKVSIDEI
jgi:hypothetical protein